MKRRTKDKRHASSVLPEFLSISETSFITGLSLKDIQKKCSDGEYELFQPQGPQGRLYIQTKSFLESSRIAAKEIIRKRKEMFKK